MSLKGRIKNYAKKNNIAAQVVLQNYMFERFLERLSKSEYSNTFVIKGGVLVASIVGLDIRSPMDLDTTIRNLPLSKKKVLETIHSICDIDLHDDTKFVVNSISPIRKDDIYGGYCVKLNAIYESIVTPLSIDVSTGDVITPSAIMYNFEGIFDQDLSISLWGYNIETVLAEKVETILRRGSFNTRLRDFYDVYILCTTQKYDRNTFKKALEATSNHRESIHLISDSNKILDELSQNTELKAMCIKYQNKYPYASNVSYESIMNILNDLMSGNNT